MKKLDIDMNKELLKSIIQKINLVLFEIANGNISNELFDDIAKIQKQIDEL
jgi:hypothetical protein